MEKLIAALKSLLSDIESMKYYDEKGWFGPFSESQETLDGATIEWPNLGISADDVKKALAEYEHGAVIEGELAKPVIEAAKALCSSITEEDAMDTPLHMAPKLIDLGQAVQDLEAGEELQP